MDINTLVIYDLTNNQYRVIKDEGMLKMLEINDLWLIYEMNLSMLMLQAYYEWLIDNNKLNNNNKHKLQNKIKKCPYYQLLYTTNLIKKIIKQFYKDNLNQYSKKITDIKKRITNTLTQSIIKQEKKQDNSYQINYYQVKCDNCGFIDYVNVDSYCFKCGSYDKTIIS